MFRSVLTELVQMVGNDAKLLYKKTKEMPEATVAALRTTRVGTSLSEDVCCCVRESPIHGQGLFATKDIEKGDLITLYPIDVAVYEVLIPDTSKYKSMVCYSEYPVRESLRPDVVGDTIMDNRAYAHVVAANGMPLTMALETTTARDPAYLGHWANDATILVPAAENEPDRVKKRAFLEYEEASYEATNAEHVSIARGIFVFTVAKRAIKNGEEITVSYGKDWWTSWLRHESTHVQERAITEEHDTESVHVPHDVTCS